jgi:probable HAF family extracellular repeat protein
MRRLLGLAVAIFVLTSTLSAAAQLAPEDLEALAGDSSLAPWHINRHDQVTGMSAQGVFSWTEAEGIAYVPRSSTRGFAIPANMRSVNDNGQVVGTDFPDYPESLTAHAFSWTREGGVVNLGTLGGPYSEATAVNNRG